MLNWDDLNFFKSIASERSFRRAAAKLELSVNTIRGRIDRLERALDMSLFNRGRDGLSLSNEGISALDIVLEMDSAISRLTPRGAIDRALAGKALTICCTEGVGEFWLAPRLPALSELIGANVSFHCDSDQDRIHSVERDICIGFARPTNPETIVCKLATLHFTFCASTAYLDRYGHPRSMDDLDGHRIIVHQSYGLDCEAMCRFVGKDRAGRLIAAEMNSSHALCQAIAAGFGIGALPTYLYGLACGIEPLDLPVALACDLWLSFNRSTMSSQTNRDAVDWIKGCFRQADYPWFGEDFINPREFPAARMARTHRFPDGALRDSLVPAAGIEPAAP